ncbi:sensor histidine kinase [Inhella proteolytica]|uniref:histidine kinase n=1 Tax=Inhella proteolytica TaxID=2795029 RepID=A0A931J2X9_9BURK|nr:HAMP domain-containing sensor histidine kinase [Inhella proteolytica]MBH9575362.1 HAMP domain-containing histidine kinase [Inhella proteolytica]
MNPLLQPLARLRRSTFRRQLTVAVGVGVVLIAALSALLSSWQGSLRVRENLRQQGLSLAIGLAQQSQLALLTQSPDNAAAPIERAFYYPDMLRFELLLGSGELLAARGEAPALAASRPLNLPEGAYMEAESDEAWSFVAPVRTQAGEASPFEAEAARSELLGQVRITLSKQALTQLTRHLVLVNFAVALACALLLLWMLRRLTLRLTEPLGELAEVMAQAGTTGPGLRARPHGPRDLQRMAQVFNRMMATLEQREAELQTKNEELARHAATLEQRVTDRTLSLTRTNAELQQALDTLQEAQKQLVESDKLASLGSLVAGVAHELNTPLGNALIAATALEAEQRQLRTRFEAGQLRKSELQGGLDHGVESSELVHRNVQRAADIIRGFKQLAIDQTTEMRRKFKADEVLREILGSLGPMFKASPYRIETELDPGLEMDSYPGPLGQVITNIAQNARLHGFDGRPSGVLQVQCHAWGEDHVQIVCSDDGHGMDEEVRLRVFEAFFTTKFGQGGSGLGMQIVHTLVNGLLGGRVSVDSAPGAGTRVILTLPRVAPQRSGKEA